MQKEAIVCVQQQQHCLLFGDGRGNPRVNKSVGTNESIQMDGWMDGWTGNTLSLYFCHPIANHGGYNTMYLLSMSIYPSVGRFSFSWSCYEALRSLVLNSEEKISESEPKSNLGTIRS